MSTRAQWASDPFATAWLQAYVQRYGVRDEDQLDKLFELYSDGMSPDEANNAIGKVSK